MNERFVVACDVVDGLLTKLGFDTRTGTFDIDWEGDQLVIDRLYAVWPDPLARNLEPEPLSDSQS